MEYCFEMVYATHPHGLHVTLLYFCRSYGFQHEASIASKLNGLEIASAAHRVLTILYPDPSSVSLWNATLAESLSSIPADQARQRSLDFGIEVADAILASRQSDGSSIMDCRPNGYLSILG
jgi:hypothetical protein